jgi:hypothetical protein
MSQKVPPSSTSIAGLHLSSHTEPSPAYRASLLRASGSAFMFVPHIKAAPPTSHAPIVASCQKLRTTGLQSNRLLAISRRASMNTTQTVTLPSSHPRAYRPTSSAPQTPSTCGLPHHDSSPELGSFVTHFQSLSDSHLLRDRWIEV